CEADSRRTLAIGANWTRLGLKRSVLHAPRCVEDVDRVANCGRRTHTSASHPYGGALSTRRRGRERDRRFDVYSVKKASFVWSNGFALVAVMFGAVTRNVWPRLSITRRVRRPLSSRRSGNQS